MNSVIGHCDTLMNFDKTGKYDFYKLNNDFHVDLPRLQAGKVKIATFAVFVEPEYKPRLALERTLVLIERFLTVVEGNREILHIKDNSDIKRVFKENKMGLILSLEGAEAVVDISFVNLFHRLGVRMVSLTWNQRNQLADGVGELEANGGLTKFGKKVLAEMNKLKMIIDVSHLCPGSLQDVLKYSKSPVVASHSNSRAICDHPRNLTDTEIKALARKGGLIGLNFAPPFLKKEGEVAINDLLKHIDYIRNLVGLEYIALGTDFDGISATPVGLEDVSKLVKLEKALLAQGYSENDVEMIFMKNWLRVFKDVWG